MIWSWKQWHHHFRIITRACSSVFLTNESYRSLKTDLDNNHLLKKDAYTKTLYMELKFLLNFHTPGNVTLHTVPAGVAFVQRGKAHGVNGEVKTNHQWKSECFYCGKKDHWQNYWSDLTEKGKIVTLIDIWYQLGKCRCIVWWWRLYWWINWGRSRTFSYQNE